MNPTCPRQYTICFSLRVIKQAYLAWRNFTGGRHASAPGSGCA